MPIRSGDMSRDCEADQIRLGKLHPGCVPLRAMYLFANVTGHNNHEKQHEGRGKGKSNGWFNGVNHFNPSSPLYEGKDAKLILLSDLGIAITATVLVILSKTYGFSNMAVWYFAPYLWVNHWLGMSSKKISQDLRISY